MRAAPCLIALLALPAAAIADPLPSWRDGTARDRITAFVAGVTEPGGPDYVMPAHRIAVFDNDGTLWAEKPVHFQVLFALDRIAAMVYQPMLELLACPRDEGFATYIVSGGGIDFMRAFAEDVYGIPPAQVIGSSGDAACEVEGGVPAMRRDPGLLLIDDKAGKAGRIARHVGLRPIFVAGNWDGDFVMLEWSTAGSGPSRGVTLHHIDAERELAYGYCLMSVASSPGSTRGRSAAG